MFRYMTIVILWYKYKFIHNTTKLPLVTNKSSISKKLNEIHVLLKWENFLSVFTHLSWPMYLINMYNTKKKTIIIFITHKMAITRKIDFQINFDYKVMTNYKMIISN